MNEKWPGPHGRKIYQWGFEEGMLDEGAKKLRTLYVPDVMQDEGSRDELVIDGHTYYRGHQGDYNIERKKYRSEAAPVGAKRMPAHRGRYGR